MMVLGPKAPQSLFQNYSISSLYSYTVYTQNGSSSKNAEEECVDHAHHESIYIQFSLRMQLVHHICFI